MTIDGIRQLRQSRRNFRAVTGISLEEQRQVAAEVYESGSHFLEKWQSMKKFTKQHKKTTRRMTEKYDWLHEAAHLKKLERNVSTELETLVNSILAQDETSSDLVPLERPEEEEEEDMQTLIQSHYNQELELHQQSNMVREEILETKGILFNIMEARQAYLRGQSHDSVGDDEWFSNMQDQLNYLMMDTVAGHGLLLEQLNHESEAVETEFKMIYESLLKCMYEKSDETDDIEVAVDGVGGRDCPDPLLRLETIETIRILVVAHETEVHELKSQFISNLAEKGIYFRDKSVAFTKTGDWTQDLHTRYMKVYKECTMKGIRDKRMIQKLQIALPDLTPEALHQHDTWFRSLRTFTEQKKDKSLAYDRKRREVLETARQSFLKVSKEREDAERRKKEQDERLDKCGELKSKLMRLKEQKAARDRILAQQKLLEEEKRKYMEQQEQKKREAELAEKKKQIQSFKDEKAKEKIAEETEAAEKKKRQDQERRQQNIVNATRVEFRTELLEKTRQQHAEMRKQMEEEAKLQKERIDALAKETPYAEKLANLKLDPERARGATIAFTANKDNATAGLPVHESGLFPTHGYDCDKLFKDARFKLGLALRDAGLHTTGYARAAMTNIKVQNSSSYRNVMQRPTQLW